MSVAAHACASCMPLDLRRARSALIGLLSVCALSLHCRGQDDPAPTAGGADSGSIKRFSLTFGIDAVTAYEFRGFVYEDTGPIIQPYAEFALLVAETESAEISLLLSTWHSFHGQATWAQTDDPFREHWFEADISAGVGLDVGQWSFEAWYNRYMSPSDAWPTMQEISLLVSYADDWLPAGWSLNPHALMAFEIGPAANDGMRNGAFFEMGVSPAYEFADGPCDAVTLSFPLAVGLSLSNYYEDEEGRNDPFGYLRLGAVATIPLGSMGCSDWSLSLGIEALMLGGAAAAFNDGERSVLVGSIGLAMEF